MNDSEPPTPRLRWLGQAGFILQDQDRTIVIDPYLSDSLARKYAGSLFEHVRRHPPPADPRELVCDLVICTHRHTDHMDGATLTALTAANPDLRICVPRAEVEHAAAIGLERNRIVEMSAGETFRPLEGVSVTPIPAAHEQLSTDANGEHRFLGVIISTGTTTIYHSGDCVPYDGLADILRDAEIEIALLPVNGRDAYRQRHGVPGNFWVDEAIELCEAARIPTLIGHHFGLFDFNTVPPEHLDRAVAMSSTNVRWIRPEVGEWVKFV
jgi:L-ascorbate metabolism protein UlaG (beta-lactamase superfamily)